MTLAREAPRELPRRKVCRTLGLACATFYRRLRPRLLPRPPKAVPHPRALSSQERAAVLAVLHEDRFADLAPAQVYATLLDEGRYIASIRTMYRVLAAHGEVRERRRVASHPKRTPPELCATAPGQVWTWDITHLRTTAEGASLKLYVCMDLFSRHVVGWYLSASETAAEARHFFQALATRENVDPAGLVLHADNGAPMRGRALADLLESLGVERSHSRPRTSNDNAFSEAQFKTMKYRPTYPRAFESEADARAWCRQFFRWYNHEHRHEGLALLTPADVRFGRVEERLALRAETLAAACEQHPARFVKGTPAPKRPPETVSINPHTQPPREPANAGTTSILQAAEVAK